MQCNAIHCSAMQHRFAGAMQAALIVWEKKWQQMVTDAVLNHSTQYYNNDNVNIRQYNNSIMQCNIIRCREPFDSLCSAWGGFESSLNSNTIYFLCLKFEFGFSFPEHVALTPCIIHIYCILQFHSICKSNIVVWLGFHVCMYHLNVFHPIFGACYSVFLRMIMIVKLMMPRS